MGCIALVVAMVAGAGAWDGKDGIFPEIAAVAFGAWVLDDRPWPGPAWTLWFSPTLAALTGVLVLRFVPVPLAWMVGLAFVLVLLELQVSRSSISPAFSAAVLPILTGIRGWLYPASVCLMTALVAGIAHHKERRKPAIAPTRARSCRFAQGSRLRTLVQYGKLSLCILVVALAVIRLGWWFVLAPPLLVAFVELSLPECRWRRQRLRLLFCLTAAALAGTLWVEAIVSWLSGPLWLAAGLAAATGFPLAAVFRIQAPPAFALALLPTILPVEALPLYPAQVLLGSLLLIAAVSVLFPAPAE